MIYLDFFFRIKIFYQTYVCILFLNTFLTFSVTSSFCLYSFFILFKLFFFLFKKRTVWFDVPFPPTFNTYYVLTFFFVSEWPFLFRLFKLLPSFEISSIYGHSSKFLYHQGQFIIIFIFIFLRVCIS